MNGSSSSSTSPTLLGHPPGLFTLFFAEMWERFSYYGMRALLLFYMIKGFLGYSDAKAYAVYGAYTGLVYATPFIGGMLADRLLGQRFAVILGGLLMAAGHLTMTVQNEFVFFFALALLILGNGFFKPNISTMVGGLYPKISGKKDAGFTIFYMGINLGAAISPILCGYVGETYGWHKGFGLATAGMLIGVAIFVAPTRLTQALVLFGALTTAGTMIFQEQVEPLVAGMLNMATVPAELTNLQYFSRVFLGVALLISGAVAVVALSRGGIPENVGGPPSNERLRQVSMPWLQGKRLLIYTFTVLVLGLAVVAYGLLTETPRDAVCLGLAAVAALCVPRLTSIPAVLIGTLGMLPLIAVILQRGRLAGVILASFGLVAFGSLVLAAVKSEKVDRERMFVVLILTFFSMLFWAFFEQAGSSMNNFADRNVDRAQESRTVTADDVGSTVTFRIPVTTADPVLTGLPLLSQEQLGYPGSRGLFNMTQLSELREAPQSAAETLPPTQVTWTLTEAHIGMGILEAGNSEIPASEFQAANAIFILIFGLFFTAIWGFLRQRGWEPSTPVKFSLGLLQVGLGFLALWYGALLADDRGMVAMLWLLLAYLLHTTGELCLSPVGLSMVTKLSPARIVSTVMGAWFLATAFSNYLAGLIAMLTRVSHGEDDQIVPPPQETLDLYSQVFGKIAIVAIVSALICFALTPLLKRWMHLGAEEEVNPARS